MKSFFTDNIGWKLLSVVCSFAIWVAVAHEPELATSISVPILFKDLPDDLAIATDVPERVHLLIRGLARRLTPESLAETEVVLDLSNIQTGDRTFTIHDWNIRGLPFGVAFSGAVPSQVVLHFDHVVTKEVPIEPSYENAAPDGYMVMSYSFAPPKAKIRGPDGRAQAIDHVTTDPIDLSGIVSKAERRVHVRIGDPQMRLESSPVVQFTVELGKINKDNK